MVFTEDDKPFIKNLYLIKGYGLRRLARESSLGRTVNGDSDGMIDRGLCVTNGAIGLSLYHNCDSTAIRLRHDYDEKLTCSFFARVESRQMEAGVRDTS